MSLYIPIFTHCISRYPHFPSSLLSLALSFYLPLVLANNVDEYEIGHYAGTQSSRNLTVFASFERTDHDVASSHPAYGPPCILTAEHVSIHTATRGGYSVFYTYNGSNIIALTS